MAFNKLKKMLWYTAQNVADEEQDDMDNITNSPGATRSPSSLYPTNYQPPTDADQQAQEDSEDDEWKKRLANRQNN